MTDESIRLLETAALNFAATHRKVHNSMQEHAAKCAAASALLIAAALELNENEPTDQP